MEKKTIEKMRDAVLAYCEAVCPNDEDQWIDEVIGLRIRCAMTNSNWKESKMIWIANAHGASVSVSPREKDNTAFVYLYRLLGISERDAVAAEKSRLLKRYKARIKRLRANDAETHRIQIEVKDERISALETRNAALVAALESLKRAVGYKPRRHGEIVLYRNDLGVFIDNAIAANEKGGANER